MRGTRHRTAVVPAEDSVRCADQLSRRRVRERAWAWYLGRDQAHTLAPPLCWTIPANATVPLTSPESFFHSVGGLHDAILDRLTWVPDQRRLEVAVQDLHSSFEGLPEDPGRCPAVLAFVDVTSLRLNVDLTEHGLMVYDVTIARTKKGQLSVTVAFSPSGTIALHCRDIECADARLHGASPA
jgi:hypothetical protein